MTKFITSAAVSALVIASATASFAGNLNASNDEGEPTVFAAPSSGVGAGAIAAGVVGLAALAAAASGGDSATTTTGEED